MKLGIMTGHDLGGIKRVSDLGYAKFGVNSELGEKGDKYFGKLLFEE